MLLELILGGVFSASLAYLISVVNQIQHDVRTLLVRVAVLESDWLDLDSERA